MIASVKVWNDSDFEHVEQFREDTIRIPARGYIEMGRSEAIAFQGQFRPFQREGSIENLGLKRIRIEEDLEIKAERYQQPFKFEAPDGKQFRTEFGLKRYMSEIKNPKKSA